MPWMNLATLFSVLRRKKIDPRMVEVYVEEESINPRPRNPRRESFEPDQETGDEDQYDYDEDEY